MSRTGVLIVIGIALILSGALIFVTVMSINHWDFTKLETTSYTTNTYPIGDTFDNLHIQADTAKIILKPSDNGACRVVCFESEQQKHNVTVKDGTLTVSLTENEQKWYHYIGINVKSPSITVYLPEQIYSSLTIRNNTGDITLPKPFQFRTIDIQCSTSDIECEAYATESLKIRTTTGDVDLENACMGDMEIAVSTGDIEIRDIVCQGDIRIECNTGDTELSHITCKNLTAKGNTGDMDLENVIASEKLSVNGNTTDIRFQKCDAGEIFMKTRTGNIKGSLLSGKVFVANANTGSVHVPSSGNGGVCEVSAGTGNIRITIENTDR